MTFNQKEASLPAVPRADAVPTPPRLSAAGIPPNDSGRRHGPHRAVFDQYTGLPGLSKRRRPESQTIQERSWFAGTTRGVGHNGDQFRQNHPRRSPHAISLALQVAGRETDARVAR